MAMLKANYVVEHSVDAIYTGGVITASGEYIVTPKDTDVNIAYVESGARICTIKDDSPVSCVALHPDGDVLLVFYRNLLMKSYQVPSGKPIKSWRSLHRGPVLCTDFGDFDSATVLATGSADCSVRVWDLDKGFCTHNYVGPGVVTAVRLWREKLVCAYATGQIDVRDLKVKGSEPLASLRNHTSAVPAVDIFGDFLVSAGRDQVINLWNLETFQLVKSFPVYEPVSALSKATESEETDVFEILFGCDTGRLEFWKFDRERIEVVKKLTSAGTAGTGITQILAVPGSGIVKFVISLENQNLLFLNSSLKVENALSGFNDEVMAVALLPSRNKIIVACNSKEIRIYDEKSWTCKLQGGHSDLVLGVASYDHIWPGIFASCSKDNSILVWNADENGTICKLAVATGHTASVTAVRFCSKGVEHFLCSVGDDKTLKIWMLPKEELIVRKKSDENLVKLETAGTVVAHQKDITSLDISPNDKLIATGSLDKTAKIWSLELKGKRQRVAVLAPMLTLVGHKRGIWDVRFSSRDQVVVTSSGDGLVKIWALVDGACIRTFEGHESAVLNARFLPSGLQLLSADTHGLMKLWTIKTNECVKTWDHHDSKIWALSVSDDASKIYTGGADSKILVWKDVTEEEENVKMEESAEVMEKEQRLSNYLQSKKFSKALQLAINLDRPFTALTIIKQLLSVPAGGAKLLEVLGGFDQTIHERLMSYAVDWNTNSKNCHVAQLILSFVFKSYAPDRLLEFGNIEKILEALIPYSERHFERMNTLKQNSTFVDYIYRNMGKL